MAGGLFGQPFVFNEKCIFFSLLCMILFLYKPTFKNKYYLYFSLFLIFVFAYVAMAWYDYFFDCNILPLKRGEKGLTGKFKPPAHKKDKQEKHKETLRDTKNKKIFIYLSHLLFVVPILIYIIIYKNKVNNNIYPILGVLATFTALYHGSYLMVLFH